MPIWKPWKRPGRLRFVSIDRINIALLSRLRDGLKCILRMSRFGNQYLQMKQPWAKQKGSDADR